MIILNIVPWAYNIHLIIKYKANTETNKNLTFSNNLKKNKKLETSNLLWKNTELQPSHQFLLHVIIGVICQFFGCTNI